MGSTLLLMTRGKMMNQGTLSCNGLDGDMYIVADCFVNEGILECAPNGELYIFCREYVNNGVITPQPNVAMVSMMMDKYGAHMMVHQYLHLMERKSAKKVYDNMKRTV